MKLFKDFCNRLQKIQNCGFLDSIGLKSRSFAMFTSDEGVKNAQLWAPVLKHW